MKRMFFESARPMICAGALLLAAPVLAQGLPPRGQFVVNVDCARFRNDDRSSYVELYYGFYPQLLTFHQADGKYHAGIKLQTRILEKSSRKLVADRSSHLTLAEADTFGAWYRYPFVTQAGFMLPFGEYTMEVVAADSLQPARVDTVTALLNTTALLAGVAMSDLELCKNISNSSKKDELFYKNSLEVLPHPSLVFGAATAPVVFHYVELYNLKPRETYRVKATIYDGVGKVARESAKPRKYAAAHSVEVGTSNVTTLPSGKYLLRLTLSDSGGNALASAEKGFYAYNPQLDPVPASSAVVPGKSKLSGMSTEDLTLEFRQAQYMATKDETKIFSKLETAEGKREFLMNFWKEVEPGRRDFFPVTRAEYLQRVKIVNERYPAMGKDGWQTNRGRVYLLYGEPDEIERAPSSSSTKPRETWRYLNIEDGVEFVFIDRYGDGDYSMVHSTKRGEVSDPEWERGLN